MNFKFKSLILILGLVSSVALTKAAAFEGVLDYHITTGDHQIDVEYLIKGHKLRFNGSEKMQNAAGIMDMDSKTMTLLMPKQKMFMKNQLTDYKKLGDKAQGKFSDTGRSDTILGYTCEEYLYQTKTGEAHVWLASNLGVFAGLGGKADAMDSWVKVAQEKGLFPLKSVYKDQNGKEKSTMTATKVSKQSVDDSNFQVPADYKEMKMPNVDMGQLAPKAGDIQMPKVKIPGF